MQVEEQHDKCITEFLAQTTKIYVNVKPRCYKMLAAMIECIQNVHAQKEPAFRWSSFSLCKACPTCKCRPVSSEHVEPSHVTGPSTKKWNTISTTRTHTNMDSWQRDKNQKWTHSWSCTCPNYLEYCNHCLGDMVLFFDNVKELVWQCSVSNYVFATINHWAFVQRTVSMLTLIGGIAPRLTMAPRVWAWNGIASIWWMPS